jgi:hypothetical protein
MSTSGTILVIGVPLLLAAPATETWGPRPIRAPRAPLMLGALDFSGGGVPLEFDALE